MFRNRFLEEAIAIRPVCVVKEGNSKVTKYSAVVNVPAIYTCPNDAPCKPDCYATKGTYNYDNVNLGQWQNFKFFIDDADGFFSQIEVELAEADSLRPWKWFRWHETGDIVNARYFEGMVDIAKKFPRINFMCFTKKYSIVNNWIDKNGKLPKNLTVVFSVWGYYGIGMNPHNLPMSYVKGVSDDTDKLIPKSARQCPADNCAKCGFTCWKLKRRQSVKFDMH